jgi:hypothetical protein
MEVRAIGSATRTRAGKDVKDQVVKAKKRHKLTQEEELGSREFVEIPTLSLRRRRHEVGGMSHDVEQASDRMLDFIGKEVF